MLQPFAALVTRLREHRSRKLVAEATVLFRHAANLYETAGQSCRQRRVAHLLAARAERLTARSYLWRPATDPEQGSS